MPRKPVKKAEDTGLTTKNAVKKSSTKAKSAKSTRKPATKSKVSSITKKTKKAVTESKIKRSTKSKETSKIAKSNLKLEEIDINSITSETNLTHQIEISEYYDLPYRYNQTVVKVLAQTPTTLFIYWDISDADRSNFVEQYGENFFNYTKPILVIHNKTMHYSYEIEIDDFANNWYLHVNDANCEYTVELGRRPKYYNDEKHVDISNDYLYVTSSNIIDSPNDHVLFDRNSKTVYFKDVKTNIITEKDITSISFLRNMGRIYNLYDLQSDFSKNSWLNNNKWQLDLQNNPSSSSSFIQ